MTPAGIRAPLCPQCCPFSFPRLLLDPSVLPWSWHCQAEGSGSPTAQKKGKNSSAPEGRSCKNPLTKSSREASLKIPQEEAASPTTGRFSPPFPRQLHLQLCRKIRISPLRQGQGQTTFISHLPAWKEREKNAWAQREGELKKAQVPFFKGGRLVGIPGSLNLGVNTFPWLGFFSLFLNFRTGAVTAPPHFPLGEGGKSHKQRAKPQR